MRRHESVAQGEDSDQEQYARSPWAKDAGKESDGKQRTPRDRDPRGYTLGDVLHERIETAAQRDRAREGRPQDGREPVAFAPLRPHHREQSSQGDEARWDQDVREMIPVE